MTQARRDARPRAELRNQLLLACALYAADRRDDAIRELGLAIVRCAQHRLARTVLDAGTPEYSTSSAPSKIISTCTAPRTARLDLRRGGMCDRAAPRRRFLKRLASSLPRSSRRRFIQSPPVARTLLARLVVYSPTEPFAVPATITTPVDVLSSLLQR
ncbi:hypothetical protein ACFVKB_44550 [Rhodococcus sp. NPDC127530]|uniref:hypothetical protein n=1 Tax=Rhodococcus sp. NPDC127530 TaxID=3345397 RepID=UPI00362BF9F9